MMCFKRTGTILLPNLIPQLFIFQISKRTALGLSA
ncbi:hypothetical protein EVA_03693 [gut metagenome]|uniref:Uncharacterized protein n=1 Tax=gut metagenome TaxID=749906 RepID=J9GYE9_9ZZZZ